MEKPVLVSDIVYKNKILNELYDYSIKNIYTDITIMLKNDEIAAHRVILAAASEVFYTMFRVNMKEKFERKVNFEHFGLSNKAIRDLIKYIYAGEITLSVENVEEIIACANFFMINRLKEDCCKFMLDALVSSNCLGILSISSKFGCEDLKLKALKIVQEEFSLVAFEEEFLHLNADELYELLSSDFIEIENEDVVLDALIRWFEFATNERSKFIDKLFSCVRIQYLSENCFSKANLWIFKNLCAEVYVARQVYASTAIGNDCELTHIEQKIFPRRCLDTSVVIMTTGGYDGNSCLLSSFVYPLGKNKWGHLAPMLVSRHDHGTVSLKNRMYVIGGFNSHCGPLNRAEYFNSIRNEWTEISPMSFKRKSLGVCIYRDKLFVSGGLDGNYNALESVEYFDAEQETWTNFIPMHQARYSHGFVGNEQGLFAIGGWKLNTGERFYNGEWHMIAPLNVPRAGATSIIRNNKIYVFGGYSVAQCTSSVEIYDIELDFWTSGASSRIPRWRAGSALVDKNFYVIGGRNSSWQYLDAVESYDLESHQWEERESLPCKVMGLRCSVLEVPKHSIQ